MNWALDDLDTRIFWLNGMAGTGKTTIAYSFCELLDRSKMLGASFFCSRSDDNTRNPSIIFPTIVFRLANNSDFCSALLNAVKEDPDVASSNLTTQSKKLIIDPCELAA